jgi:hypothetical protein
MECSKSFTIEVSDVSACCFALDSSPAIGATPASSCYAVDDDRVVVAYNVNDVDFINATTDLVVGTIVGFGTFPSYLIYSPVNNRVYSHDQATADILEINPNTMTHSNTIAPPVGVTALSEPCYDATNDLIYYPGSTATDIVIMRFNPQTLIPDVLVTIANPGIGTTLTACRSRHIQRPNLHPLLFGRWTGNYSGLFSGLQRGGCVACHGFGTGSNWKQRRGAVLLG